MINLSFSNHTFTNENNISNEDMQTISAFCILAKFNDPNIIRFNVQYNNGKFFIEYEQIPVNICQFYLMSELRPEQIKHYARQMLSCLYTFHSNQLLHCNLSPATIFIDENNNIKISSFHYVKFGGAHNYVPLLYRAPELIENPDALYTFSSEIWCMGCIIAEMIFRKPLFLERDEYCTLNRIKRIVGETFNETKYRIELLLQQNNKNTDPLLVNLISQMLCLNPFQRIQHQKLFIT